MANTTNFGWETPDDTDLVKDGAAAMRTLGNAIDTSFVDLKGGTTGQVLSKASNTDLDFTWVAQDDSNAIQNAIVDAKGDLISATATDTPARLAVGNNGETLVADSSATTGLRWQGNFAAGKNKVINGDFNIWQRGTSFTNPGTSFSYTADRFQSGANNPTTTHTVSQQSFTLGTAPVAGYESAFFYRSTLTNIGTATVVVTYHKIEDVRTFAGQTATFSFWAKADSARSVTLDIIQEFGSGGSGAVTAGTQTFSLTTSWQRFSMTVSVPSISGKTIGTGSRLQMTWNQAVANGSVLDLWGVQAEAGSVATAFQTATGTLAGELAACQRYYQRFSIDTDGHTGFIGNAYLTTASSVTRGSLVSMRTTPSSVDYSNVNLYDGVTFYAITGLTIWAATENHTFALLPTGATGLTQYRSYFLVSNGAAGFVALSAEL